MLQTLSQVLLAVLLLLLALARTLAALGERWLERPHHG